MLLGRMSREGSMYEADSPALVPHPGKELVPQLQEAVQKLPAGIARGQSAVVETTRTSVAVAADDQKEGSYQISNGEVRQVRLGELASPDFGEDILVAKHAKQWIALREAAKSLFSNDLDPQSTEMEIEVDRR